MVKYTLIVEYLLKGNNYTQVATLCSCSRMTVWYVLKRIDYFGFSLENINDSGEEELRCLLFPERKKKGEGYLIPDFKWEEFQMCKHSSSIRLCWRRYCKRAAKQNLRAYSWKSFITLYNAYRKPRPIEYDQNDKIRTKLKHYNLYLSFCYPNGKTYLNLKKEKEDWLKSLGLDENKILDNREKHN